MSASVNLLEDKIIPLQEKFDKFYTKITKYLEEFEIQCDIELKESLLKSSSKLIILLEKNVKYL